MAETPEEEVDELIGGVQEQDDDSDDGSADDADDEEAPKPAKRRRVRRSGTSRRQKEPQAKTLEEMEIDELLPQGLPKPDGTLKSIGDLYAKFGIGTHPDMKVHLYRTYPKIAPGGVKFDGFYDEYDMPITEQQVQAEYGGGQYRIVIVGPNPKNPRLPKHYGSHSISLAGNPNFDRMPRALRKPDDSAKSDGATNPNPPPHPMMAQAENPKLAEAALKMFESVASAERAERQRVEKRIEEERAAALASSAPLAEAERRRADDLIRAERERSETQSRFYEQQLESTRMTLEEMKRDMERVERSRPSIGEELRGLAEVGLLGRDNGSAAATEMFNRVLEKHRDEIAALNKSHSDFVASIREGHASELRALRDAHSRELAAEREASKSREDRIEERLRAEREERERDRTRYRESMEERDRHWKDRMDQALQTQQSSWEARHTAAISTYENRVTWLQQEIDKLKSENYELRSKHEEKGDIMTQLLRHKELGSLMKEMSGADASQSSASSSGGIGLSGGNDDWKGVAVEAAMERMPLILEKLFGGGSTQANQQAAQQFAQQFTEGQVVETPQGKMEVVRDPQSGQLALAPKEALDRHRAQVAAAQQGGGGLLQPPARPAQRGGRQRQRSRSAGVSAVPNLAEGLPRRRPPWEGGGDEEPSTADVHIPPPPPPPPPQPRMTTRSSEQASVADPMELSNTERQALRMIAREVHESVSQADDPDEFVQKMMSKYPENVLRQIVGEYTDRQIIRGVVQMEPRSAGATPGGQQFMMDSFKTLRRVLS